MKKSQGRKVKKAANKMSSKALKSASQNARKVKTKTGQLLSSAKKKLNNLRKSSSKTLNNAKNKIYATEEEIMAYVKKNPVKSASALALTGLIAGFIATMKRKS